jgi:hypothetical protein
MQRLDSGLDVVAVAGLPRCGRIGQTGRWLHHGADEDKSAEKRCGGDSGAPE